jgi:methionyl-tRNA formyltransferase
MTKALFLGSKALGIKMLDCVRAAETSVTWTIIHPNDTSDPRGALDSFTDYARINNIDILIASSAAEAKEMIHDLSPDIILVCGWYWLLDQITLANVPFGLFGIHNSLLPKYRGCAPLVWSIINGDNEVGASVFKFTPGMDDGDILLQVRVSNEIHDTIGTILYKIENALVEEMPKKWQSLLNGSAVLYKQNANDATYGGQRVPEDGHINWAKLAWHVHDFIRAQTTPYPGAFSFVGDKKVVIHRTEPDGRVFYGTPGQVLFRHDGKVTIACGGKSAINICEISVDGIPQVPTSIIRSMSTRLH